MTMFASLFRSTPLMLCVWHLILLIHLLPYNCVDGSSPVGCSALLQGGIRCLSNASRHSSCFFEVNVNHRGAVSWDMDDNDVVVCTVDGDAALKLQVPSFFGASADTQRWVFNLTSDNDHSVMGYFEVSTPRTYRNAFHTVTDVVSAYGSRCLSSSGTWLSNFLSWNSSIVYACGNYTRAEGGGGRAITLRWQSIRLSFQLRSSNFTTLVSVVPLLSSDVLIAANTSNNESMVCIPTNGGVIISSEVASYLTDPFVVPQHHFGTSLHHIGMDSTPAFQAAFNCSQPLGFLTSLMVNPDDDGSSGYYAANRYDQFYPYRYDQTVAAMLQHWIEGSDGGGSKPLLMQFVSASFTESTSARLMFRFQRLPTSLLLTWVPDISPAVTSLQPVVVPMTLLSVDVSTLTSVNRNGHVVQQLLYLQWISTYNVSVWYSNSTLDANRSNMAPPLWYCHTFLNASTACAVACNGDTLRYPTPYPNSNDTRRTSTNITVTVASSPRDCHRCIATAFTALSCAVVSTGWDAAALHPSVVAWPLNNGSTTVAGCNYFSLMSNGTVAVLAGFVSSTDYGSAADGGVEEGAAARAPLRAPTTMWELWIHVNTTLRTDIVSLSTMGLPVMSPRLVPEQLANGEDTQAICESCYGSLRPSLDPLLLRCASSWSSASTSMLPLAMTSMRRAATETTDTSPAAASGVYPWMTAAWLASIDTKSVCGVHGVWNSSSLWCSCDDGWSTNPLQNAWNATGFEWCSVLSAYLTASPTAASSSGTSSTITAAVAATATSFFAAWWSGMTSGRTNYVVISVAIGGVTVGLCVWCARGVLRCLCRRPRRSRHHRHRRRRGVTGGGLLLPPDLDIRDNGGRECPPFGAITWHDGDRSASSMPSGVERNDWRSHWVSMLRRDTRRGPPSPEAIDRTSSQTQSSRSSGSRTTEESDDGVFSSASSAQNSSLNATEYHRRYHRRHCSRHQAPFG